MEVRMLRFPEVAIELDCLQTKNSTATGRRIAIKENKSERERNIPSHHSLISQNFGRGLIWTCFYIADFSSSRRMRSIVSCSSVWNRNISSTEHSVTSESYLTPSLYYFPPTATSLCPQTCDYRFGEHGNYHIQTRAATYTYHSPVITEHANTASEQLMFFRAPPSNVEGEGSSEYEFLLSLHVLLSLFH